MALHHPQHPHERQGHCEGDEGQQPVVGQHDRSDDQHESTVQQPRHATPGEELGERLHVGCHTGNQGTTPLFAVVGEAQLMDVRDHAHPEVVERPFAAPSEAKHGGALTERAEDDGRGSDAAEASHETHAHTIRRDPVVDRLLDRDGDHHSAGRTEDREREGQRETLAQPGRLVDAAAEDVSGTEAAAELFVLHQPPPLGASVAPARSTSKASMMER